MSTLLISIDRTSLGLAPLVFSADEDEHPLGISGYTEPGRQVRVSYMPDEDNVHGSEPVAWSWQEGLLSWETFPAAASEAASRALFTEVVAAVTQWSFPVTVTVADAAPEVWSAHPGSAVLSGGRTVDDLEAHDPAWVITIPVHPIPQGA